MAKGIAEATTKIYEQLQGLAAEERLRAVKAALTMLGEPTSIGDVSSATPAPSPDDPPVDGFSPKGKAWIKKHKLTPAVLQEMFHLDNGKVELIGSAIGASKREQTINTYLLTGIAAYLETGTPAFADDVARHNCQHLGCYDSPNHANYVRAFKNKITGSKSAGWTLTAPGLDAAAKLIQSQQEGDE